MTIYLFFLFYRLYDDFIKQRVWFGYIHSGLPTTIPYLTLLKEDLEKKIAWKLLS